MPRKRAALLDAPTSTECFLCTLADNDDEEPLRDRLARAMAYGVHVIAEGEGLLTCNRCHKAFVAEEAELLEALEEGKRSSG